MSGGGRAQTYPCTCVTLLRGIEQAQLLDPRVISCHQPCANVPAIADARDQDAVREPVGAALRGSNALAHAGHHHGPAVDPAGDQFALLEAKLAIVQIGAVPRRQFAVEKDGKTRPAPAPCGRG